MITLLASDYGFVERVRELLKDGILLPGRVELGDVVHRVGMAYFDADPPPKRRAIYLDTLSRECEPSFLDRVIAKGAAAGHPFLHLCAPERWIPKRLAAASDLDITVTVSIDWRILADTVNVVLGTDLAGLQIKTRYENVYPELLMPSDLALAIRPGRSVDEVFAALARLSEVRVLEDDGDGEDEETGGGSKKPLKTPGGHKTVDKFVIIVGQQAVPEQGQGLGLGTRSSRCRGRNPRMGRRAAQRIKPRTGQPTSASRRSPATERQETGRSS